jgi:TRAP-type mannitol/chloroaromatic compound transport system permease small subunit
MERAPTAFRPYLWPVKVVMCVGFFLMILQAVSCLIRDIATIRGEAIE